MGNECFRSRIENGITRLVRIFWKGSLVLSVALCVTTCALWIMAPETVPPYTVARHSIEFWHGGQRWQLTMSRESGYLINNWPQIEAEEKRWEKDAVDYMSKLDKLARAASERLSSLKPGTPEFAAAAEGRARLVDARMRAFVRRSNSYPPALASTSAAGLALSSAYVIAASAILPGLWLLSLLGPVLVRRRRRRRMLKGLCPECGYDVRASPARCPECGAG
jgi:hypothetical protein